jgi:hypothetical protein
VITARRTSDNATQDFTAKEVGSGDVESFSNGGGVRVRRWYDQSGNGRDASQNALNNQPRIVENGSLVRISSGSPAIDFSINSSHLDLSTQLASGPTHWTTASYHGAAPSGESRLYDYQGTDRMVLAYEGFGGVYFNSFWHGSKIPSPNQQQSIGLVTSKGIWIDGVQTQSFSTAQTDLSDSGGVDTPDIVSDSFKPFDAPITEQIWWPTDTIDLSAVQQEQVKYYS